MRFIFMQFKLDFSFHLNMSNFSKLDMTSINKHKNAKILQEIDLDSDINYAFHRFTLFFLDWRVYSI